MNIIMLGAPGTGKGTVAAILKEKLGLQHLSSGDIFRECIAKKDELAQELDGYLSKGALVPDDLTIRIVENRLNQPDMENGVILDGFPRTIEQAKELDNFFAQKGKKVDLVINLTTPEEEVIERIITRRICSNQECKTVFNLKLHPPKVEGKCDVCGADLIQRKDDTRETVKSRLETYFKQTSPLVEFYNNKQVLQTEEVSEKINRFGNEVAEDIAIDLKNKM